MLADSDAWRTIIGSRAIEAAPKLPDQPHQVESNTNPKQTVDALISLALDARIRRRHKDRAAIQERLGQEIRLDRLERVPSYKQFTDDLMETLRALRLVT